MVSKASNKSDSDRGETPSASKLGAISLCRGHHMATKRFPWYGDRDMANEGTARHDHEEHQTPLEEIIDDERRICAFRARRALSWCREDLGIDCMDTEIGREVRLWWEDKWSGQLDYLETYSVNEGSGLEKHAFLADYKMLRGIHDPANKNIQLLAQACLVVKNDPDVQRVFVALVEPFQEPSYTTASFSSAFLWEKGEELTAIVDEAMQENAPRTAGPVQCKWCSALPFCPEARELLKTTMEGKI